MRFSHSSTLVLVNCSTVYSSRSASAICCARVFPLASRSAISFFATGDCIAFCKTCDQFAALLVQVCLLILQFGGVYTCCRLRLWLQGLQFPFALPPIRVSVQERRRRHQQPGLRTTHFFKVSSSPFNVSRLLVALSMNFWLSAIFCFKFCHLFAKLFWALWWNGVALVQLCIGEHLAGFCNHIFGQVLTAMWASGFAIVRLFVFGEPIRTQLVLFVLDSVNFSLMVCHFYTPGVYVLAHLLNLTFLVFHLVFKGSACCVGFKGCILRLCFGIKYDLLAFRLQGVHPVLLVLFRYWRRIAAVTSAIALSISAISLSMLSISTSIAWNLRFRASSYGFGQSLVGFVPIRLSIASCRQFRQVICHLPSQGGGLLWSNFGIGDCSGSWNNCSRCNFQPILTKNAGLVIILNKEESMIASMRLVYSPTFTSSTNIRCGFPLNTLSTCPRGPLPNLQRTHVLGWFLHHQRQSHPTHYIRHCAILRHWHVFLLRNLCGLVCPYRKEAKWKHRNVLTYPFHFRPKSL